AHEVAAHPVRLRLDQDRTATASGVLDPGTSGSVHGWRIVAVDDHAGHAVPGRPAGNVLDLHHRLHRRRRGVLVVLAEEDDWQVPDGRQVHRLMDRATIRGAVPKKAQRDLISASETRRDG